MKRVESVNRWYAMMSENGKYDPVAERHENGRKVRCDKGIRRSCANCLFYVRNEDPYFNEVGIYVGGLCQRTSEIMISCAWCNHWRK